MGLFSLSTFVVVGLCAFLSMVPGWLSARDTALRLRYPIPQMPAHGRVTTISHNAETMAKIASDGDIPVSSFASSFDMYYEAQLEDCDPTKNFVVISGTNGASYLYHDIIAHFRKQGYCTLNFDHRAHGRSAIVPGELTAELIAEDAAAIIHKVFGGRPVHVLGWSLGGAVAYYLTLEHPKLVQSLALQGMTSCFGKVLPDGTCDTAFDVIKWFFSRDLMLRLLGTELQGKAAVAALKMHDTDDTMFFFRTLSTATMTRTPATWGRWRTQYYQDRIHEIKVPVILIAGEHEKLVGFDDASMGEDVKRIGKLAEYKIFPGFSHFMWYENFNGQSGLGLSMGALDDFYAKHFTKQ